MEVFPPVFNKASPTAKSNIKYRHVTVDDILKFDARGSISRLPNPVLKYRWQILRKPAGSLAKFHQPNKPESPFSVDASGEYALCLEVEDVNGRTDRFDILLSTEESNLPRTSFIAMGDFGTGGDGQYDVAKAIEKLCASKECDFVIGLGDNFYPRGVKSLRDRQFKTKFEGPYKNIPLPFYMTLGNHDTAGISDSDGILNVRGDIQIAYAKWRDKPSFRWQMPARYYRISAPVDAPDKQPLVDLYALDTTLLTSPIDVIPRYDLADIYQKEGAWLAHEKALSKAQWQIAFGHHPYLSNGEHSNAGSYENLSKYKEPEILKRVSGEYVKQFLEEHVCGDIPLYIAGHEHTMQYLKPHADCKGTEFIVSGAGAKTTLLKNAEANPVYWQHDASPGFFYIQLMANRMIVTAYTVAEGEKEAVEQYRRIVTQD